MSNNIALVTGANRGIGYAICSRLLKDGHTVILTSRDKQKGQDAIDSLIKERGAENLYYQQMDVSNQESVAQTVKAVEEKHGRLDWLINNAGINYDTEHNVLDPDIEESKRTIDVNFFGPWRTSAAFAKLLRKSDNGRIVNVSSGSGQLSEMAGGTPAYSTSKAALNALTIKLAAELKSDDIKVNAVCPGWVATDMGGSEAPRNTEEGAGSVVWAAYIDNNGPSGGFYRDGERLEW